MNQKDNADRIRVICTSLEQQEFEAKPVHTYVHIYE